MHTFDEVKFFVVVVFVLFFRIQSNYQILELAERTLLLWFLLKTKINLLLGQIQTVYSSVRYNVCYLKSF